MEMFTDFPLMILTYYPTSSYPGDRRITLTTTSDSLITKMIPKKWKMPDEFKPLLQECKTNKRAQEIFIELLKVDPRGMQLEVCYDSHYKFCEQVKTFEELRNVAAIACKRGVSKPSRFTFAPLKPRLEGKETRPSITSSITMIGTPTSQNQNETQVHSSASLCFCSLSSIPTTPSTAEES